MEFEIKHAEKGGHWLFLNGKKNSYYEFDASPCVANWISTIINRLIDSGEEVKVIIE